MVTFTEKATLRPNTSMKSTERINTGCRPNLKDRGGKDRERKMQQSVQKLSQNEEEEAFDVQPGERDHSSYCFPQPLWTSWFKGGSVGQWVRSELRPCGPAHFFTLFPWLLIPNTMQGLFFPRASSGGSQGRRRDHNEFNGRRRTDLKGHFTKLQKDIFSLSLAKEFIGHMSFGK